MHQSRGSDQAVDHRKCVLGGQPPPGLRYRDSDRKDLLPVHRLYLGEPTLQTLRLRRVLRTDSLDPLADLPQRQHAQENLVCSYLLEPADYTSVSSPSLSQLGNDVGVE